ncbi:MAG: primosomal protein N' [Planctomycetota bacterium]
MQDALFPTEDAEPSPAAKLSEHELASARYARVAVERGIDHRAAGGSSAADADGFTYRLPSDLDATPGDRVLVPLGRGNTPTNGVVLAVGGPELLAGFDPRKAKAILKVERLGLPTTVTDLARWIAQYYLSPLGMALAAMVPAAVKKGTGARTKAHIIRAETPTEPPKLTPSVTKAWAKIEALPDSTFPIEPRALADRIGSKTIAPINRLKDAGLLSQTQVETITARSRLFDAPAERARSASEGPPPPPSLPTLTSEQATAISAITQTLGTFTPHLLFGITGSGKTEVYLRLIQTVLDAGQSAIVLVPEIALTPQTSRRFQDRFAHAGVAVFHSGLSASQRHRAWADARAGNARVVVGARSAVFAPLTNVGLIVVDEEHDSSYKQDQLPRYHARDVAIKRAQLEACPVVLGSATPSLESWHNATRPNAKFHLHKLVTRPTGAVLPEVRIADIANERKLAAKRSTPFTPGAIGLGPTLLDALDETLLAGGQAILLLNRRGFAACVACRHQTCGWTLGCERCDARMVVHTRSAKPGQDPPRGHLKCHHCLAEQLAPTTCPDCQSRLILMGEGTQRLEDNLRAHMGAKHPTLPESAVARADSDALTHAAHYFELLDKFATGETKILLGTQMIAKGLDFPNVRLVGVVNADTALALPDFRASERTFQLITQVAGRAGRADHPGRVIVQTLSPDEPAIVCAQRHDYETFAAAELQTRRDAGLPPISRLARIVCRHKDPGEAEHRASDLAQRLRAHERLTVHGPMPCPLARINEHFRFAVEIYAANAPILIEALSAVRAQGALHADAHTAVDLDPVALL